MTRGPFVHNGMAHICSHVHSHSVGFARSLPVIGLCSIRDELVFVTVTAMSPLKGALLMYDQSVVSRARVIFVSASPV